ncbi:hypothetical protein B9Z51_09860 [Limnohabitans sp. T6-5]|nr:hypothetical protein B9Z51_09860 [Limnohabitans sp. T6-5]
MIVCMKFWYQLAVLSSCITGALAQSAAPQADKLPERSALDAVLFYQVLLGELNVREGSAGSGFSIMLDAARKTRDPALFQRAVDIALQARSGEAALQAAQTWKKELSQATEPNRYILQILLALNRIEEAGHALAVSINELPLAEQAPAIASVPGVFGRVQDKSLAADVVEKALAKALKRPETAASAWTTIGRMRRDANQIPQAVDAAVKGHTADPHAQGPLILSLSLMSTSSNTLKPLLDAAMKQDTSAPLRLGYARTLIALQQTPEALAQLSLLNTKFPEFFDGWLVHGLLLLENNQATDAESRLQQYVRLTAQNKDPEHQAGRTEALFALSQIAQRQGHLGRAHQWLAQMPVGADPIKLASRQAELLSLEGRLDEARQVLAQIKTTTPEQALQKSLAQSQWLRENQQAEQAYSLVKTALAASPNHAELQTELALICEKLKKFDEMEALLRQIMKSNPKEPHAFNALGYSLADRKLRLDEARMLITQAAALSPQDAFIQDSLGWVAFRQGNHAEALEILRAAYKARQDAEIAAHLGEVLWNMGLTQEAGAIWREGLQLKAGNETLQETIKRFNFKP